MRGHRSVSMILAFALCAFDTVWCAAQEAPAVLPIEYVPYSVTVDVQAPADVESLIREPERWQSDLLGAMNRQVGPRWDLTLTLGSDAAWARSSVWRAMQASTIRSHIHDPKAEFVYLVRLQQRGGSVAAEVRVWEPLVAALSPVRTVTVQDPRDLPDRIATTAWELFRPRGHWQKVDDGHARLQIQAAGLGADSALPPLIEPGESFVPWIVLRKRDQSVDRTVPQLWTYLIADKLQEGRGDARIASGLRNPLSLKPRGRVEFIAVAARPQWNETTITFRRQSSPPEVLAAHETLWQADQFPRDETNPPPVHRQLTNRFGTVTLSRDPTSRLGWLSISSGRQLLARLPVVPGEEHQREVLLTDDRLRLQVEGQLQLVESDLVSFVATRTALMAITRAAAKKSEWENVDARLKQLNALPTPQSFADRVSAIRVNATAGARKQKDRTAEQRIARMADDTLELVTRYLNDDKLTVLKEEVAELRAADMEANDVQKGKGKTP